MNPELALKSDQWWDTLPVTPLQQVVGFPVSEEIYDRLEIRDQLILDLLMAGWNQTQIGRVLTISQSTVSIRQKGIRYALANTRLKMILEMRVRT